jgi:hypothetical protein
MNAVLGTGAALDAAFCMLQSHGYLEQGAEKSMHSTHDRACAARDPCRASQVGTGAAVDGVH